MILFDVIPTKKYHRQKNESTSRISQRYIIYERTLTVELWKIEFYNMLKSSEQNVEFFPYFPMKILVISKQSWNNNSANRIHLIWFEIKNGNIHRILKTWSNSHEIVRIEQTNFKWTKTRWTRLIILFDKSIKNWKRIFIISSWIHFFVHNIKQLLLKILLMFMSEATFKKRIRLFQQSCLKLKINFQ